MKKSDFIMLLKGKNIIITGSGRGIGKAVAIACAKEGANVGYYRGDCHEQSEKPGSFWVCPTETTAA